MSTLLFGGAITAAIPADFRDVSDIRPVEDNQTIFARINGQPEGEALIVELLDLLSPTDVADMPTGPLPSAPSSPDALACLAHYYEIADINDSTKTSVDAVTAIAVPPPDVQRRLGAGASVLMLSGRQHCGKYRHAEEPGPLAVHLALLRVPTVNTDILVTVSSPLSPDMDETAVLAAAQGIVADVATSLAIRDWGLFN
jgi:hypothetical protein